MKLSDAKPGQVLKIVAITDDDTESQMIRMGLASGDIVTCLSRVLSGPTILRRGAIEIAIGHQLTQTIEVCTIEVCLP